MLSIVRSLVSGATLVEAIFAYFVGIVTVGEVILAKE